MTDGETKQIRVNEADAAVLRRLKRDGETWPDVVRRLLDGDVSEQEIEAARTLAEPVAPEV